MSLRDWNGCDDCEIGAHALGERAGACTMKVVIFCGGLGVRMGEADAADPEADDHGRRTGRSSGTS